MCVAKGPRTLATEDKCSPRPQPVLKLHRAPSQPKPLPLGPRVLPLGGACVMVHVIHPSVVLSLLCQGEEKRSQIGTS